VSAAVSFHLFILDRYILRQMIGTMFSVLAVVMSLMVLEHLPRLLELTRFSGHREYIIMHTVAGLLPEYGGIGLLVGLFLGIALTIRRLALRGELDVVEACGISPLRWMRLPVVLAAIMSVLTIVNQGWLMPAGEIKLMEIGKRMMEGEFGHRIRAGEFIDLGSGSVLQFEQVDAANGDLIGLFLRTERNIFTARRGRIWRLPSEKTAVELQDGQVIEVQSERVSDFAHLQFGVQEAKGAWKDEPKDRVVRRADIGSLWVTGTTSSRSAVYGRCLWAALALLLPFLALVLGKPARRQAGSAGIFIGVISLVGGLKMITPLVDGNASEPEFLAGGILATWGFVVAGLIWAEKAFGQGFVDLWLSRILQKFYKPSA
jgi:lipopolysaccharide export system permease protein